MSQQQYQPHQQQYVYSRGLPSTQQQRQYIMQHDSSILSHRNMPHQRQYLQYQVSSLIFKNLKNVTKT